MVLLVLISMITACAGVPLRSLPQLMRLQSEVLEANPAEFMLAIQVDVRMEPPPDATPILQIAIRPSEPGAFKAIDKRLPMRFTIASTGVLGLAPPSENRRWLIYSLSPESQTELLDLQHSFKYIQSQKHDKQGARISIGIAQDNVATKDPSLANSRWESWLQTSQREGFFELWSGSIAELLRLAEREAAATPQTTN